MYNTIKCLIIIIILIMIITAFIRYILYTKLPKNVIISEAAMILNGECISKYTTKDYTKTFRKIIKWLKYEEFGYYNDHIIDLIVIDTINQLSGIMITSGLLSNRLNIMSDSTYKNILNSYYNNETINTMFRCYEFVPLSNNMILYRGVYSGNKIYCRLSKNGRKYKTIKFNTGRHYQFINNFCDYILDQFSEDFYINGCKIVDLSFECAEAVCEKNSYTSRFKEMLRKVRISILDNNSYPFACTEKQDIENFVKIPIISTKSKVQGIEFCSCIYYDTELDCYHASYAAKMPDEDAYCSFIERDTYYDLDELKRIYLMYIHNYFTLLLAINIIVHFDYAVKSSDNIKEVMYDIIYGEI